MDSLSEENANENIKIFSGLLVELEKVRTITKINTFKYTKKRYEQSQKYIHLSILKKGTNNHKKK